MDNHTFYILWGEALNNDERDHYVSEWSTSSLMLDPEREDDIPQEVIDYVGTIWDVAHTSLAGIRKSTGLTQAQFAERFCLSRRTVEDWESRNKCPDHIRLMMAEILGLIKR